MREREQSTSAVSNKSYEKFYKYLQRDSVEQPRASALHKGLFEKIFVSTKDTRLLTTIPNVSWLGEGGYFPLLYKFLFLPCLHIWVELTYFLLPLCLSSSSPPSPLLFHMVLLILPDTILHFLFC